MYCHIISIRWIWFTSHYNGYQAGGDLVEEVDTGDNCNDAYQGVDWVGKHEFTEPTLLATI